MDDENEINPLQRAQRPAAPSVDGFLRTTNQSAQPRHRSVTPLSASTGRPEQPAEALQVQPFGRQPAASAAPRPRQDIAPPSASKHPFQTPDFYKPIDIPKLPDIKEEIREVKEPPKRPQGLRDLMSVMGVLASALLLAFCLINFVFQSYQVEGPSMRTTLENQDHLIVWKVDKTISNITGRQYVPHRGDVIIFNEPANAEAGGRPGKQLIKRVIATPGERVVFNDADVIVYNKEYPNGFHPDKEMPYGDKIINEKPSNVDVTLGEDEIFVAGDNRDNSLDSRIFGPLKTDKIVGKLVVRILPLNTFKLF